MTSKIKLQDLGELDARNFRDYAQMAILRYENKDALADAEVWSEIIGEYEKERTELLTALREAVARLRGLTPDNKGHAAFVDKTLDNIDNILTKVERR